MRSLGCLHNWRHERPGQQPAHLGRLAQPHVTGAQQFADGLGHDESAAAADAGQGRAVKIAHGAQLSGAGVVPVSAETRIFLGYVNQRLTSGSGTQTVKETPEEQKKMGYTGSAVGVQAGVEMAGHSMVIDPWGEILAEGGAGEEIVYAEFDPALVASTREGFPVLKDRRL